MIDDLQIVSLDERDRWEAAHRIDGLPSQSWRYASALNASGIEPKLAVVTARGARMLLPFFEREWLGTTDIATIRGLSGASIESHVVRTARTLEGIRRLPGLDSGICPARTVGGGARTAS